MIRRQPPHPAEKLRVGAAVERAWLAVGARRGWERAVACDTGWYTRCVPLHEGVRWDSVKAGW
ncbi:hypothetical protein CHLRE_13g590626v5 [Chlamydomonas reinhardtii]|uniref:Uncharacterized protein n=1 Tax=Chlamydomonas reinhardtii TaxID=3055 RepID=A0A2K3D122_CHLRE|nr:uncharacterized protein CHLRE_13g590626v5 [Chlamydomonas reinhardtii]PNW74235.1 hypothetical protein CHLRE_13g590626v5 [Chlamydomonas reinhardtii]